MPTSFHPLIRVALLMLVVWTVSIGSTLLLRGQFPGESNTLAYIANRGVYARIHITDTARNQHYTLTDQTYSPDMLAWSPDGSRLAFVSDHEGNKEIYLLDVWTGAVENLTQYVNYDGSPVWSPDGSQLAFISWRSNNWDIYTLDLTDPQRGTRNLTARSGAEDTASWSPDGTRLAFVADWDNTALNLYLLDLTSGSLRQLTDHLTVDDLPVWSPDGSTLAFVSQRDFNFEIYALDVEQGGEPRNLTRRQSDEFGTPLWSPDGTEIIFASFLQGDGYEVFVMDADGGNQRQITDGALDTIPLLWSPGGESLVLRSVRSGDWKLYLLDVDCFPLPETCESTIRPLTQLRGTEYAPAWKP